MKGIASKHTQRRFKFILAHPLDSENARINTVESIISNFDHVDFVTFRPENYQDANFLKKISNKENYEAIFVNMSGKSATRILLPHFPNIKWVQVLATGVKPFLEIPEINDSKITLTNLRSVSSELLGEFALSGALFFAKRLREYLEFSEVKHWKDPELYNVGALCGKTALIIGLGSIGMDIARKCKLGFGMEVYGIKRDLENIDDFTKQVVDKIHSLSDLFILAEQADFIFVTLPEIEGQPVIFTDKFFGSVKQNSVFINVGRGSYVDEAAMIEALKNGKLAGAALDVFQKEPIDHESELYTNPVVKKKVLMTCHSIDHSQFLLDKTERMIKENIERYITGKKLNGIVNKKFGY